MMMTIRTRLARSRIFGSMVHILNRHLLTTLYVGPAVRKVETLNLRLGHISRIRLPGAKNIIDYIR